MAAVDEAREAGYSEDEIKAFLAPRIKQAQDEGYSPEEIGKHLGLRPIDHAAANQALAQNVQTEITKAQSGGRTKQALQAMGQTVKDAATVYAPIEAGLNLATGAVLGFPAYLLGGIGGLVARHTYSPDTDPKEIATKFAQVMTYAPMTDAGTRFTTTVTSPLHALVEMSESAGKGVADKTDSPTLAAITEATIQMLPAFLVPSMGRRVNGKVPDNSEFHTAAAELTRKEPRVNEAGVAETIAANPDVVKRIESKLQDVYEKVGIDPKSLLDEARKDPTIIADLASSNKTPFAKTERLEPTLTVKDATLVRMEAAEAEMAALVRKYKSNPKFAQYFKDGDFDRGWARIVDAHGAELSKSTLDQLMPRTAKDWETGETLLAADSVRGTHIFDFREEIAQRRLDEANAPKKLPEDTPTPGSAEAAQKTVLDRVVLEEPSGTGMSFSKFYTAVKNDLYPIVELERKLSTGGTLSVAESPYHIARLTRGAAGKATQFLEYGAFDFNTYKTTGPGLKQILAPFDKDLNGLRAYLVARRAQELHTRGMATGVPAAEAATVVKNGTKYEAAAKQLYEFQNSMATYLRDSGLLGDEAYLAMRELNKDYVPFHRVIENAGSGGAGAGLKVHNPIRRIHGSERAILDPLESIIKNAYVYTALAERNAVGRALGKLVDADPAAAAALGVVKEKQSIRAIEVTDAEIARAVMKQEAMSDLDAFTIFRPNAMQPGPGQIRYYENGKPQILNVPPEVAEAFSAVNRESAGLLTKIMAAPASTLRAGAVLTPDFMARNVIRDQLTAFTFSKTGYIPVWDMLRGAMSIAKKDTEFQNWLKSGGANSAMVALDRSYLQQHLQALNKDTGLMRRSWNVVSSPIEVLRITSELAENATRVGEFKRAKASTKPEMQAAAFVAREITLDFSRIGAQTQGLNMIAAFMNAGLEGKDRTVRAFKDNPIGTSAKVAASITTPSILLWYANNSTPERQARWREVPNWQRDLFWIVMTDDNTYRIPKPFELGVIFGSSAERILDQFAADKPEAIAGFVKSMSTMAAVNVLPTGAVPLLEHTTNYSLFKDNPLIPSRMEGILPEYQYHEYTSELSKAVGGIVGAFPGLREKSIASPIVIDNYIRGWTGGLGVYATQLLDAGLRQAGVLPDPPKPIATLADLPVVKAFVVRYPSASAQSVQDFYDKYRSRTTAYNTFQYLVKNGDADAAIKVAKLDVAAFARMDGVYKSLGALNSAIRLVHKNPTIPPDEQRQLIDSMYGQMIEIARAGNAAMLQVDSVLEGK
jgi:hypothetical protein